MVEPLGLKYVTFVLPTYHIDISSFGVAKYVKFYYSI